MEAVLPASAEQAIIVRERLRLLEIGYYIRGGITVAFASFFLLYVVMMLEISFIPDSAWATSANARSSVTASTDSALPAATSTPHPAQPPPKLMFRLFAGIFGIFVALGWGLRRSWLTPAGVFAGEENLS